MTKMVKILLVDERFHEDSYGNERIIRDAITDWEEITDEEYEFLRTNLWRLYQDYDKQYRLNASLIVKDGEPVSHRINSIKERIAEDKRIEAEKKAKEQAKKLEREQKKRQKKEQDELALLKQLQEKFGVKT